MRAVFEMQSSRRLMKFVCPQNRIWVWAIVALYVLLLSDLTLTPDPLWFMGSWGDEAEHAVDSTFADYLQHGLAYLLLAVLLVWGTSTTSRPSKATCSLFALTHAMGTEWLQGFIPQRTCDWTDAMANVLGVGVGWFAATLTIRRTLVVEPHRLEPDDNLNRL